LLSVVGVQLKKKRHQSWCETSRPFVLVAASLHNNVMVLREMPQALPLYGAPLVCCSHNERV
jgi:hypothetical protein